MTDAAAISASYADFKLIKSRSSAQIILEIPIEHAERFIAAFGMPIPGSEKPVALALLRSTTAQPAVPEREPSAGVGKKRWHEMSRAQQAGVLCHDESFVEWIGAADEDEAAMKVRHQCGVFSRAELDKEPTAGKRWDEIVSNYRMFTQGMAEVRR